MATEKLSILWVVLDCVRFDHISAHGYRSSTTPHLDDLIATGLDYTHAVSAATWSLPSYTSLLTGLYPRQHGVNHTGQSLGGQVTTLAQCLQAAGYVTACFSNNAWLDPSFGLDAGFQRFDRTWYSAQASLSAKVSFLADKLSGVLRGHVDKGARYTTHRLIQWMRTYRDQPTFGFVAFVEPHTPYTNYGRVLPLLEKISRRWLDRSGVSSTIWAENLPARRELDTDLLRELGRRYDLEVSYLDNMIGGLLAQMKQEDLLDNTIIIVTSDHGELLGEHHMLGHQFSVSEALRRVPLIIWSPTIWSRARQITDIVQTVDLPTTICGWADLRWERTGWTHVLPERDGLGTREFAITDYPEPYLNVVRRLYPDKDLSSLAVGLSCCSDKRYKLVRTSDDKWWGIDLEVDPSEENHLDVDRHSEFSRLQTHLKRYLAEQPVMAETEQPELSEDVLQRLRALGYVD